MSQDFPANNSVPDSPRTRPTKKHPASPAQHRHTVLWVRREDEGETEAEPARKDRNDRTVSAGRGTCSFISAFIFPQRKKRDQRVFAFQKNILKKKKILPSCPNIWEGRESSLSRAERQRTSFLAHIAITLLFCPLVIIEKYPLIRKGKRSQRALLFPHST